MSDITAAAPIPTRTHPLSAIVRSALNLGAAVAAMAVGGVFNDPRLPGVVGVSLTLGAVLVAAVALGLISWATTTFMVENEAIRLDSGLLRRTSRRVTFDRIQSVELNEPFLARLVSLVEVKVIAAGNDGQVALRFLARDHALELRSQLLRATGQRSEVDGPQPAADDLILAIPPGRTVLGVVLSTVMIRPLLAAAALGAVVLGFDLPLVLLGGAVPMALSAGKELADRLLGEWNFTLRRTDDGIQSQKGMLSRASQSVRLDRIQGVLISEPLLWRRLRWQRIEVEVAGQDLEDVLVGRGGVAVMPIGTPAQGRDLLDELIGYPLQVDPHTAVIARVPSRARWFGPWGRAQRWISSHDRGSIACDGWLNRTLSMTPHTKAQSISIKQGPLQRRLGLATIAVHSPFGPVDVELKNVDQEQAVRLQRQVLGQIRATRTSAAADTGFGLGVEIAQDEPRVEPPVR